MATATPPTVASGTFEPVLGPEAPAYEAGSWTALPASPVGPPEWVNRFVLQDGSGWVDAGLRSTVTSSEDLSREIAYFSVADRRWLQLPDLPLTAGLGDQPTGIRIGDALVVVGVDCPASVGASMAGAEFCAPAGASSKVALIYDLKAGRWQRVGVPVDLVDFREASPWVIGQRAGRVVVAARRDSVDEPGTRFRLSELDPGTGAWTRLEYPADVEPGRFAEVCVVDHHIVQVTWSAVFDPEPPTLSRLEGETWTAPLPLGDLPSAEPFCAGSGIYLQERFAAPTRSGALRLTFAQLDGSSRDVADVEAQIQSPKINGDVMVATPMTSALPWAAQVFLPTGRLGAEAVPGGLPYDVTTVGPLLVDEWAMRSVVPGAAG